MRSSALRTTLGLACGLVIAVASNDAAAEQTGACCLDRICIIVTEDACVALGGTYQGDLTTCEGGGTPVTYESFPNAPLPDNAPGVSDTITVPDSVTITDVDVVLQVTHTWVGDLCVTLTHNLVTVRVIARPGLVPDTCNATGCCGCPENNYAGIILDDEGSGGAIENQCVFNLTSPPNYTPNEALSTFDGLDSAGDWTLTISDNAGLDLGTFDSWALIITSGDGPGPCDSLCAWDLNGSGDVGILDLLALLAAWGANPGHPADFDGDGNVGILDLLTLLANWGPCPRDATPAEALPGGEGG